jgi:plasmid replication initiation protein
VVRVKESHIHNIFQVSSVSTTILKTKKIQPHKVQNINHTTNTNIHPNGKKVDSFFFLIKKKVDSKLMEIGSQLLITILNKGKSLNDLEDNFFL